MQHNRAVLRTIFVICRKLLVQGMEVVLMFMISIVPRECLFLQIDPNRGLKFILNKLGSGWVTFTDDVLLIFS